jgi:hypothetical protein
MRLDRLEDTENGILVTATTRTVTLRRLSDDHTARIHTRDPVRLLPDVSELSDLVSLSRVRDTVVTAFKLAVRMPASTGASSSGPWQRRESGE